LALLLDEGDLTAGADDDRAFWQSLNGTFNGPVGELGCGGGRLLALFDEPNRLLVGIDADPHALRLARERLPGARLIEGDLRTWRPADTSVPRAGLVIAGGDLLPLLLTEADLRDLFAKAAAWLRLDGHLGLDATRIDAQLLAEAIGDPEWGSDITWHDAAGRRIDRESRLLADAEGRPSVALLQIRHRIDGEALDERAPVPIRAWQPAEVEAAAAAAGLALVEQRGSSRMRWLLRSHHG